MTKKRVIVGLLIVLAIVYAGGALVFSQKLYPTTSLGDQDMGMERKSSLEKEVKAGFADQTITITDDIVPNYEPKLADLGATIDAEKLSTDIDAQQNPLLWPVQIFQSQDFDLTKYIKVDSGKLNGALVTDGILDNDDRREPVDAKMKYNKETSEYEIKPEKGGTVLNDKFITDLQTAIEKGKTEFDATKYYKKPKVISDDLTDQAEQLNDVINRKVTVNFGDQQFVVPKAKVATFVNLDKDEKLAVQKDPLYDYLAKISEDYDNAKSTKSGRVATSYVIDSAYSQIADQLVDGTTNDIVGDTTVVETHQEKGQTSIPTSDTYIEVSISQQEMWLYNDDKLVLKTPVVTGNVKEGWDTPTGTFKVWNKETNKVLDGSTTAGQFDYKVPVDYWMAIDYTGVGIHDIDWLTTANAESSRDVYLTDGSHGCINTPDDLMKKVYDNTPLGTPVYVMP